MLKKFLCAFLAIALSLPALAQDSMDSLREVIRTRPDDSLKVEALTDLAIEYIMISDFHTALQYCKQAGALAGKVGYGKGAGDVLNIIGNIYINMGDYDKGLEYHFRAMTLREKIGHRHGLVHTLNNIGMIYQYKGESGRALDYLNRSLELATELDSKYGISNAITNIGLIFNEQGDKEKALEYYNRSLEIEKEIGNMEGIARTHVLISSIHARSGNYDEANIQLEKALEISERNGYRSITGLVRQNQASFLLDQYQFAQALPYARELIVISEEVDNKASLMSGYLLLTRIDSGLGDFRSAFASHKRYLEVKESIFNDENNRLAMEAEVNYEFEKKEQATRLEQEKKDALAAEQQKRQKLQTYALSGGLGLAFLLAITGWRGYNRKKRDNQIILTQKEEVEEQRKMIGEKQQEILDSITYARRLQRAILPPEKMVRELLPGSFIFYKPKDIVAGDFFWLATSGDKVIFAVADCTGHGVPGALVSMVCSNALDRAVREFSLTEPGKVLDKTTELVVETFMKSEEEVKDGMDISLCCFQKSTGRLSWAGANNPLWLVRSGQLTEVRPDKQPVGKHHVRQPFTTHAFDLAPGDRIFIFTDGYADQFGGERGKKFKYSQLRETILAISPLAPELQEAELGKIFDQWKGGFEQVDDICVMGVEV